MSTYRHGNGEYLYASWVTERKESTIPTNTIAPREKMAQKWPVAFRHYQSHYQVSKSSVEKLAERLRRNESLTIFLSSPFNGAQDEHIAFMNTVLPSLSKLCASKNIHISVVDMRWGITDDMSGNHETVRTCLSAIDKCDIFLGYFGARYGSSNYSTLPGPNGRTWIDEDVEYAASFPQFSYIKDYGDRSITEMEFLHAITHDKNYEKPDKPVSFVFYSDPQYDERMYNKSIGAGGAGDPSWWYRTKKDSAGPLERLKNETKVIAALPEKYISVFDNYPNPQLGASLMQACCEGLIREALKLPQNTGEAVNSPTSSTHTSVARYKLKNVVDFDEQVKSQAREYLRQGHGSGVLLVSGESGSGKSTFFQKSDSA